MLKTIVDLVFVIGFIWVLGRHTVIENKKSRDLAEAKDTNELESEWATLEVSMPKNKPRSHFQLFCRFLENHPHLFPVLRHLLSL